MENSRDKGRSHWPVSILSSASAAINMALPMVLVRLLSAEEVGLFKIFFLYLMLAPEIFMAGGLINGLSYWAGRGTKGEEAIRFSSIAVLTMGLIGFCVSLAASDWLESTLGLDSRCTFLFTAAVFGSVASVFFEEAAIARGMIWRGALYYAVFEVIRSITIITAVFYYRTLFAAFAAHTTIVLLKSAIGFVLGYRHRLVGFILRFSLGRDVARYSFPVSLAAVFGLLLSRADQFILAARLSPADFALYAIGCLSIPPLFILEHSVTRVLIPQLAEALDHGKMECALKLYSDAVSQLGFLLIPAAAGLMVFADPIIELLFTGKYLPAADFLRLFAVNYLILMVPYDSPARAAGDSRWILKNTIAVSILSVSLCFVLSGAFGAMGALTGLLTAKMVMAGSGLCYLKKTSSTNLAEIVPVASLGRYVVFSALLSLACVMASPLFSSSIAWLLVCGPLFAGIYLLIQYRWGMKVRQQEGLSVLMLTQFLGIGGLEKMVLELSTELQVKRKCPVIIFSYNQDPESSYCNFLPEFRKRGLRVCTCCKSDGFSLRVVFKILKEIKDNGVSVVHTHDLGSLIYGSFAKLLSLNSISLVHTQHSFVNLCSKKRYRLYHRVFTCFADKIVVVAEDMRIIYESLGVSPERISVIENGIAFSASDCEETIEKTCARDEILKAEIKRRGAASLDKYCSDFWIINIARLHSVKGQREALEIWSRLDDSVRKESVLIFAGPEAQKGERTALLRLIEPLPDRERVLLIGGTTVPGIWLKASDLYISCSRIEGLPLAPLEAIGGGVPALLSDIKGHEFLRGAAALYPSGDAERGAQALEEIFTKVRNKDQQWLENQHAVCRRIKSRYSIESMTAGYFALYAELKQSGLPLSCRLGRRAHSTAGL